MHGERKLNLEITTTPSAKFNSRRRRRLLLAIRIRTHTSYYIRHMHSGSIPIMSSFVHGAREENFARERERDELTTFVRDAGNICFVARFHTLFPRKEGKLLLPHGNNDRNNKRGKKKGNLITAAWTWLSL